VAARLSILAVQVTGDDRRRDEALAAKLGTAPAPEPETLDRALRAGQ